MLCWLSQFFIHCKQCCVHQHDVVFCKNIVFHDTTLSWSLLNIPRTNSNKSKWILFTKFFLCILRLPVNMRVFVSVFFFKNWDSQCSPKKPKSCISQICVLIRRPSARRVGTKPPATSVASREKAIPQKALRPLVPGRARPCQATPGRAKPFYWFVKPRKSRKSKFSG